MRRPALIATEPLLLAALLLPLVGAVLIAAVPAAWPEPARRRDAASPRGLLLTCVLAIAAGACSAGERPGVHGHRGRCPGFALAFEVEPLGMLFALIASGLWIVNSLYSIGYMRANDEAHQTRFYVCFALALAATMGIAFAGQPAHAVPVLRDC